MNSPYAGRPVVPLSDVLDPADVDAIKRRLGADAAAAISEPSGALQSSDVRVSSSRECAFRRGGRAVPRLPHRLG